MKWPGFLSLSFLSKSGWKYAAGVILLLAACVLWLVAQGSQTAQKPYKGGGGAAQIQGKRVPFVSGPKDRYGHVYQVAPPATTIAMPEHVSEEVEKDKELAESGHAVPTTKQLARTLSAAESKALHALLPNLKSRGPSHSTQAGAGSTDTGKGTAARSSAPSSASNFPGVGFTGFIPPDGGVAAGPVNVVGVVNSTIQVYDKNGNLLSSQTLSNFFNGIPGGSDFIFDPSVVYDSDIGRFWVLATSAHDSSGGDPTNRSTLLVGISNSSDIVAGGWSIFWLDDTINGDGSDGDRNACDYPHFGIDAQAIYFSCNMFSFPFFSGGSFQYAKVRIMTKDQFMGAGCCSWWDFWDLRERFLNLFTSFTVRPAIMHFSRASDGDFWVNAEGDNGTLKVRRLTNAQNCCNGVGPNLDDADQGVGSFNSPPGAQQPGTSTTIDSGDFRLLFATWQFGHLSTGQSLACNPGDGNHSCLGFTEIDVSSYPSMSNVSDFAFGVAGEDLYYPYVEQNSNADKTMVYTRSDATSTFAGAYFRGIPNSGLCINCIDGEGTLHAGAGSYVNVDSSGRNRWGDYHGAAADPDFLGVWIEGEYATSSGFSWATEIGPTYNSYNPILAFSSNPLAFGGQTVFTAGALNEFITNNGNATLDITGVSVSGDPDFTIIFDGCSFHAIQPGNSCAVTVQFRPTSAGAGAATLNVPFNNTSAGASLTGTGLQDASVTALTSSKNPSAVGAPVTFTAMVSAAPPSNGLPTGTVTFKNGAATLGTVALSAGKATLTTSTLTAGNHNITATYGGDSNFIASSTSLIQAVRQPTTTALTASVNPSAFGQPVVFTASVSPATATGTVTFKDGAVVIGTIAVASGTAKLTTATLAPGAHSITAAYNGSGVFLASTSAALSHTVSKASTRTTVLSSHNPSVFTQSVTFTATVAAIAPGSGTPIGTVTFKNGGVALGIVALSAGKATFSTSTLTPGAHSITVTYNGGVDFSTSTSAVLAQTVNKVATKTTVVSSHNPSVFNQSVTFTATVAAVAPGSGTPIGTATFKNGAVVLGTVALSAGKAMFTTAALTPGAHSITVTYNGGVDFSTSTSAVLAQTVNKVATKTTVVSSHNPSVFNQSVTFTATVAAVAPGSGTPIGTATFKNGAVVLGTVALSAGKATFSTSTLTPGPHSITVTYNGGVDFSTSTSAVLAQTVNKASVKATVVSSHNPSVFGQSVTFTATVVAVAPGSGTPIGTVTFKNGAVVLSTVALSAGKAMFTTAALTPGAHSITVTYNGSLNFNAGTSSVLAQTVNKASSSTKLTSSRNPSALGQAVIFTITVTTVAPGIGVPTGSVTLKNGGAIVGIVPLVAGKATITTSSLTHGTHSMTAVYSGSVNDLGSSSAALTQTVN